MRTVSASLAFSRALLVDALLEVADTRARRDYLVLAEVQGLPQLEFVDVLVERLLIR
jgi:hypothetical protein